MGVFKRVAKSKAVYVARKGLRKAGQAIKGRYYNKKSGVRLNNVVKDVMLLKKLVNVEKKRVTLSFANSIGQVANNTNSYNILDITPAVSQGVQSSQREGSSLKCVSYHCDMQLIHMSNTSAPVRGKVLMVLNKGAPLLTVADLQNFYAKMLNPNPFIGGATIYDYNSPRNPDFYGRYSVIQTKPFYIQPDSITSQPIYKTIRFGKKWQHHIRFDLNSSSILNGQILMITLVDGGNTGGVTSTLTGIPVTGPSTAITQNVNLTHYYVDN